MSTNRAIQHLNQKNREAKGWFRQILIIIISLILRHFTIIRGTIRPQALLSIWLKSNQWHIFKIIALKVISTPITLSSSFNKRFSTTRRWQTKFCFKIQWELNNWKDFFCTTNTKFKVNLKKSDSLSWIWCSTKTHVKTQPTKVRQILSATIAVSPVTIGNHQTSQDSSL